MPQKRASRQKRWDLHAEAEQAPLRAVFLWRRMLRDDIAKEKRNRRIAAKTVLKGYDVGGRKQDLDLK
ncbi:hypothetical protein FGLOB1_14684 [Fusarium globosum]|uniref:Uncharacterized protein n=1 Tax=Fusarium globosum TaxID=78864 RepID=A0A8H5UIF7_9HYPO|nr:hypothetical protein FGLOB1_14684 [Fusarium globosum]